MLVFLGAYVCFVIFPQRRSWVACGAALVLVISGVLSPADAFLEKINWNVMGLFFGTLILAELFMQSRVPAVLAEWLVDKTSTGRGAMLALCALAGFISIFVENVAVVLLLAPVAFSVAEKVKASPVPLLIGLAVCSNLQGTATMIGDPPSMILAGYMKMSFLDFFVYHGRPGIFFAVEIGALFSFLVLYWVFRKERQPVSLIVVEKPRSLTPSILLLMLVLGLSMAVFVDPDFKWFAGTLTMSLALTGVLWFLFVARWGTFRSLAIATDWDTTFFLIGVFVLVGGLSESGWLDRMGNWMAGALGTNAFLAFVMIVLISVLLSGFVDNVPFLLAMIPVVRQVAVQMHGSEVALLFGLLIGSCLGGNITPIGASANVVTMGLLKKRGHVVSFRQFMGIGIPFTVVAVVSACFFVWLVWGRG